MIAIILPQHIDHFDRLAKAQARMRTAETAAALQRSVKAMDDACSAIGSLPVRTAADRALAARAQEWTDTRPRLVKNAYDALAARDLYRTRRVAADRPYMRKLEGAAS